MITKELRLLLEQELERALARAELQREFMHGLLDELIGLDSYDLSAIAAAISLLHNAYRENFADKYAEDLERSPRHLALLENRNIEFTHGQR